MADPVVTRTVEHGDPSPLPEQGWLFRRLYVYAVTAALTANIFWLSLRSTDLATLRQTIRNDQGLILLFALLYLTGATAEAVARLIGAVKTTRKETITETKDEAHG